MDNNHDDTKNMTCEEYLELGLIYTRERAWSKAISCFSRAEEGFKGQKKANPPALDSYTGLAIAMAGGDLSKAILRCKKGIDGDCYQPDFYLNLGKVYLKAQDKEQAIQVFRFGLQLDEEHQGLNREIKKLGVRREPPLTFLPRDHFLNKYFGKIKKRLKSADIG